jgi:hypothetical protein
MGSPVELSPAFAKSHPLNTGHSHTNTHTCIFEPLGSSLTDVCLAYLSYWAPNSHTHTCRLYMSRWVWHSHTYAAVSLGPAFTHTCVYITTGPTVSHTHTHVYTCPTGPTVRHTHTHPRVPVSLARTFTHRLHVYMPHWVRHSHTHTPVSLGKYTRRLYMFQWVPHTCGCHIATGSHIHMCTHIPLSPTFTQALSVNWTQVYTK